MLSTYLFLSSQPQNNELPKGRGRVVTVESLLSLITIPGKQQVCNNSFLNENVLDTS